MIDLDREMRALLEEDAQHTPPVPEPTPVLRRTRRRQIGVALATVAVFAAVALGSVAGVSALVRSSERRVPIGPNVTTSPSTTPVTPMPTGTVAGLLPAVVGGSGLEGLTAERFPGLRAVGELAAAPDGTVWAIGWGGAASPLDSVSHFDGEEWTSFPVEDLPVAGWLRSVGVGPGGTVWVGTEKGLARFDGDGWTQVGPKVSLRQIAVASDGSIVVGYGGTRGGAELSGEGAVARVDDQTWTPLWDEHTSLPDHFEDFVEFVAVSPLDGSVWMTSCGCGHTFFPEGTISRFDGERWTTWVMDDVLGRFAESSPAGSYVPRAITFAPDGSLWVMTHLGDATESGVGALLRTDGQGWSAYELPARLATDWEGALAVDTNGRLWAARSGGRTLYSFNGTSWTQDDLGEGIQALAVAPDGALWLAVEGSLVRYAPSST
ncbi:MAG: hypothetical protein ACM3WR_09300 [Solirubrobacterales bacterium]